MTFYRSAFLRPAAVVPSLIFVSLPGTPLSKALAPPGDLQPDSLRAFFSYSLPDLTDFSIVILNFSLFFFAPPPPPLLPFVIRGLFDVFSQWVEWHTQPPTPGVLIDRSPFAVEDILLPSALRLVGLPSSGFPGLLLVPCDSFFFSPCPQLTLLTLSQPVSRFKPRLLGPLLSKFRDPSSCPHLVFSFP